MSIPPRAGGAVDIEHSRSSQVKSLPEPHSEEQVCRMSLPHGAGSDGSGMMLPEIS